MANKPLIPFWLLPYSWGVKGKTRAIAQAEYELTGKALDLALLEIDKPELSNVDYQTKLLDIHLKYNDITTQQYQYSVAELIADPYTRQKTLVGLQTSGFDHDIQILEIDKSHNKVSDLEYNQQLLKIKLSYGKISESEYFRSLITFIDDTTKRALAELELDYKEGKIDAPKYEKEKATLNGEPWVDVLKLSFNESNPEEGAFELDWNDQFVRSLEKQGYSAKSDDELVNLWFMLVCKNIAMEEFGGTGTFDEDVENNIASLDATAPGKKEYK